MNLEFDNLTPEEIEDLSPVALGEDELMRVEYVADDSEVLKYPLAYRDETPVDRMYVHRNNVGGSWVGPPVMWTDCGLLGKPWLKIIIRSYGRDDSPGVNCPLCIQGQVRIQSLYKTEVYDQALPKVDQTPILSLQRPKKAQTNGSS